MSHAQRDLQRRQASAALESPSKKKRVPRKAKKAAAKQGKAVAK